MTMPDKDHPVWKLLQSLVSLGGLAILAWHFGDHSDGLSGKEAVSGLVGGGLASKLAVQFVRGLFTGDT